MAAYPEIKTVEEFNKQPAEYQDAVRKIVRSHAINDRLRALVRARRQAHAEIADARFRMRVGTQPDRNSPGRPPLVPGGLWRPRSRATP